MSTCQVCGKDCLDPHTVDRIQDFSPCPLCGSKAVDWEGDNGITCLGCGLHLPPKGSDEETLAFWDQTNDRRAKRRPYRASAPCLLK